MKLTIVQGLIGDDHHSKTLAKMLAGLELGVIIRILDN